MLTTIDRIMSGEIVADIGQITLEEKRELRRLIRAGTVQKWRGAWYPVTGAPHGMLPFKTCYGLHNPWAEVRP